MDWNIKLIVFSTSQNLTGMQMHNRQSAWRCKLRTWIWACFRFLPVKSKSSFRDTVQKILHATGLHSEKPQSDQEDMGPAGHMQGRQAHRKFSKWNNLDTDHAKYKFCNYIFKLCLLKFLIPFSSLRLDFGMRKVTDRALGQNENSALYKVSTK